MPDKNKKLIGQYGEKLAVEHLKQKGYQLIEQNYRSPFGEIDIIMRDKTQLVFVEVKLRNEKWLEYGLPEDAVKSKKQHRIRKLANYYINQHREIAYADFRFDIVSIILNQQGKVNSVTHLPDAF
ncbi:MAG: YraN family protein [bacterium]|nr:YraN family protein [bacterium]